MTIKCVIIILLLSIKIMKNLLFNKWQIFNKYCKMAIKCIII